MRVIISTIGVAIVALFVHDAAACSCAPPPPKQALAAAAAVFSGKVIEIKQDGDFPQKHVKFEIAKTWKGTDGKSVVVTTMAPPLPGGANFEQGKSYLVYCYGEKDKLSTNICTRTKSLDAAADDVKELGEGKAP